MTDNTPSAGYTTTEFWTTLFIHAITLVTLFAAIFGKKLDGSKLQPLIPAGAMLASAIAQAFYSHSRGVVKAAALYSPSTMPNLALQDLPLNPVPTTGE